MENEITEVVGTEGTTTEQTNNTNTEGETTLVSLEQAINLLSDKIKVYIDTKDGMMSDDIVAIKSKLEELMSEENALKIQNLLSIVNSLDMKDESTLNLINMIKLTADSNSQNIEILNASIQENAKSDAQLAEKLGGVVDSIGSLAKKDELSNLVERVASSAVNASDKFKL